MIPTEICDITTIEAFVFRANFKLRIHKAQAQITWKAVRKLP